MNDVDSAFEEEIKNKPNREIPKCLDYSTCREKHCIGYGMVNCRYGFKRRTNSVQIPCKSYREMGN